MLFAGLASAQLETATIVGTVADRSGAVIPGAAVVVENQETATAVKLIADSNGSFIAPVLRIGSYRVRVSAAGFKTSVSENILLRVSDRARVDVSLEPGVVTETVTVSAEATMVDSESTTLGGVVSTQQVSQLPVNGRSLTQYLAWFPGSYFSGPSAA